MGPVTEHLIDLVKKQVNEHKLVLWFDPERHYQTLVQHLTLPDTPIVQYVDSFFALRYAVEPYLNNQEPPCLLIYVPLAPSDTHHALIELQMMASELRPGHPSPYANTRLSLIARNALKPILGDAVLALEKQVQSGQLSLADLDKLAERGTGFTRGVVSLIFGPGNVQDIALTFLNNDQFDTEIERKDAYAELTTLFQDAFGIESMEGETLTDYRVRLARYLLTTDFISTLLNYGEVPSRLSTIRVATQSATRQACVDLVKTWKLRRDLSESYTTHAQRIEQELGLSSISLTLAQLIHTETFLIQEKQLQATIIEGLLQQATHELVEQAQSRQSSFWAEYRPEIQATWSLIAAAGQVLLEAERIEQALKSPLNTSALVNAYTAGDQPWCLLDTVHRHMELRYYSFQFALDDHLDQLLVRARQRYMDVGSALAEYFLRSFQAEHFHIPDILRQVEMFERKVLPRLNDGKVVYFWVDALRYEMAYELARSLATDAHLELIAALGTVPTITEIGMAALLPGMQRNAHLIAIGPDKLAVELDGTILKDRKSRIDFLKTHAGVKVFDIKLDELLPKPSRKAIEGIRNADLILVTSQEIDLLGEKGNTALARKTMDEALHQLQSAFRVLGQLGIGSIVCTADHGYLFAEELSDDMKINAPGGNTADLHRRVWVGQGGTTEASYLRASIADFGLESNLDIAVPWNFACFKVRGGAEAYFHGGMSPQELIIPVLTLAPKKDTSGTTSEVEWKLILGSQKITTRLYSVQITGKAAGLFELLPPKVRIEIRSGQTCISLPVSASYGFEEATGSVQLQLSTENPQMVEPNTITLAIIQDSRQATVSLHLLDVTTGVELSKRQAIEMTISI